MNDGGLFDMILMWILVFGFLALFVWSLIWVYQDAEARGKSGCLVAFLIILLSWPLSLLGWVVFRPEHKTRQYLG